MNKPKEFWIRLPDGYFEYGTVTEEHANFLNSTHVIEYSAFINAATKCEQAQSELMSVKEQNAILIEALKEIKFHEDKYIQNSPENNTLYLTITNEALKKVGVEG